jgi:AraC-like DNA-binding protein
MSPRTFARRFPQRTGATPGRELAEGKCGQSPGKGRAEDAQN